VSGSSITPEYFQGAPYCPGVTRGRSSFMFYEPTLFFYFKADIAKYCDFEDSYWRFFMDTWIRGVLTETDTWPLIISSLIKALFFEELVRIVISRIIPFFFVLVATPVRGVEVWIQRFTKEHEGRNHLLTKFLKKTAEVVEMISLAPKLLDSSVKVAPKTLHRKMPSKDWLEGWNYRLNRLTRLKNVYSVEAHRACTFVMRGTLVVTAVVRVACMLIDGEMFKTMAQLLGYDSVIATHLRWFEENTGMTPKSTYVHTSDWAVTILVHKALGSFPGLFGSSKWLGQNVVGGSRAALAPVLLRFTFVFAVVAGLFAAGPVLFFWKIGRQQADFKKKWGKLAKEGPYGDGTYGKMIWGNMSKSQPCFEWKEHHYGPGDHPQPE